MGYLMIGAGLIIGLIGLGMGVAVIATSATTNPN